MRAYTSRHRWRFYALCFACLLLASPLRVSAVLALPKGIPQEFPQETHASASALPAGKKDLNGDGVEECVGLNNGVLTIGECSQTSRQVLWQSDAAWNVVQWTFSDLNRDGKPELTLLVWREFSSWPVERDAPGGGTIGMFHDVQGRSCHVILIGWRGDRFAELWAGSALANPILSILAADVDGDGDQELVSIEGKYSQPAIFRAGPLAVWKWNGFGFDLLERIDGTYRRLALAEQNGSWIIASQ